MSLKRKKIDGVISDVRNMVVVNKPEKNNSNFDVEIDHWVV
jgi:hypothetical protein